MAGCMAHAQNGYIFTSGLKSDVTIVYGVPRPRFPLRRGNLGELAGGFSDLDMTRLLYCAGAATPSATGHTNLSRLTHIT